MAKPVRMLLYTALALAACAAEGADAVQPATAPTLDAAEVALFEQAPGDPDYVQGNVAAARGAAEVTVFADAELTHEIAWGKVARDGSFGPLEIGDNEYPRVWIVVSNDTGSSTAVTLDNDLRAGSAQHHFSMRPGHMPVSPIGMAPTAAQQLYTASTSASFVFTCDEANAHRACSLNGASFDGRTIPEWTKLADDSYQLAVHFLDRA